MGEKASYAIKYMVFASRRAVFEALTNKREVSRYTRGAAESEPVPGGKYEVFDGNVVGTYVAAAEDGITLKWRLRGWEDGAWSTVTIKLVEKGASGTELAFLHADIPSHDRFGNSDQARMAEAGWRERIFGGMKMILGLGMEEDD